MLDAVEPLLHVVLYQPDIPQNTGNIGRTCVAVGAKLWLIRPLGFRLDDRYLHRAGMDYWENLDWEAVDTWAETQQRLPDSRVPGRRRARQREPSTRIPPANGVRRDGRATGSARRP